MNPLQLRIMMGLEDARLDQHIRFLEQSKSGVNGSAGISPGEQTTLDLCYARLDVLTS